MQSTSNDMRKIAPSSDALYMQALRAIHTAGFEWVECLHNVVLPDPSVRGYIMKNGVYVRKWLINPSTFTLATFLQTCKCKTATCKSCKCAQLKIPCLPLCHCNEWTSVMCNVCNDIFFQHFTFAYNIVHSYLILTIVT